MNNFLIKKGGRALKHHYLSRMIGRTIEELAGEDWNGHGDT
jgi:hypothetical protein